MPQKQQTTSPRKQTTTTSPRKQPKGKEPQQQQQQQTKKNQVASTDDNDEPACFPNGSPVQVCVRIRPLNDRENSLNSPSCVSYQHSFGDHCHTQIIVKEAQARTGTENKHTFTFDCICAEKTSQKTAYLSAAALLLPKIIAGYNGCCFAYGQTGSGKTYTMEGSPGNPGVIPRLCDDLFKSVGKLTAAGAIFTIKARYVEIYNENSRDLLRFTKQNTPTLKIIEDPRRGFIVSGATEVGLETVDDLTKLIQKGTKQRTVGETSMNAVSSRSHAILTLFLHQIYKNPKKEIQSKLSLVDLAGSERAKDTEAVGDRLREGANINKSLSTLGTVINALTEKKSTFVPYRNSSLTRLLQDSLGGNSLVTVYANASPSLVNSAETVSTLRFADRAKQLQNLVSKNVKVSKIGELQKENQRLREELEALRKGLSRPIRCCCLSCTLL